MHRSGRGVKAFAPPGSSSTGRLTKSPDLDFAIELPTLFILLLILLLLATAAAMKSKMRSKSKSLLQRHQVGLCQWP